jgi:hypothetical protein
MRQDIREGCDANTSLVQPDASLRGIPFGMEQSEDGASWILQPKSVSYSMDNATLSPDTVPGDETASRAETARRPFASSRLHRLASPMCWPKSRALNR